MLRLSRFIIFWVIIPIPAPPCLVSSYSPVSKSHPDAGVMSASFLISLTSFLHLSPHFRLLHCPALGHLATMPHLSPVQSNCNDTKEQGGHHDTHCSILQLHFESTMQRQRGWAHTVQQSYRVWHEMNSSKVYESCLMPLRETSQKAWVLIVQTADMMLV